MATKYPASIDNGLSLPLLNDNISGVNAASVNILQGAIIAIEATLGVKPQGIYSTVQARLSAIEAIVTGGGSLVLGGDVTGNFSTTKVVALQGNAVNADVLSASTDGYLLTWVNAATKWEAKPAPAGFTPGGDLTGNSTNQYVVTMTGGSSPGPVKLTGTYLGLNGSAATYPTSGQLRASGATNIIGGFTNSTNYVALAQDSSGGLYVGSDNAFNSNYPNVYLTATTAVDIVSNNTSIFYFTGLQTNPHYFELYDVTTPYLIGSRGQASDAATNSLTIQGQYAFASATGTHRTPGNLIFDIGAPTNSSTSEAFFQFTRSGSAIGQLGAFGASPSQILLWLGTQPFTANNPSFISDGSTFTYLNSPTTTAPLGFVAGNTSFLLYMAPAVASAYFGSSTTAAPLVIDYNTVNTTKLYSGTTNTTFNIGTNHSGATLVLQAGAASTVATATSTLLTIASTVGLQLDNLAGNGDGYANIDNSGNVTFGTFSSLATTLSQNSSFTLAGDVTGPAASNTVTKIRNNPVTAQTLNSGVDGYVLTWDNTDGYWRAAKPTILQLEIVFTAGIFQTAQNQFQRVGGREIDFSKYPATIGALTRQVDFYVTLNSTSASVTASAQLFDTTDNVVITGTLFSTVLTSPTTFSVLNLTVGSSSGNLRNDQIAQYQVQIEATGSTGVDQAIISNARLVISYR